MKVRIGIGVGRTLLEPVEFTGLGRAIEEFGFDSIWVSDVLSGGGLDPFVALSYLAAAVPGLKLGTTMLLPGRNPARLAKSLATLDRLSGGKLLVTFVPGLTEGIERTAVGVEPKARGAALDETLPVIRALLSGDPVSYDGPSGRVEGIRISPRPGQGPLEFWLGGMANSALDRCGRIGDGWLPSLCTPEQAGSGRATILEVAAAHGREIDPEHFGVNISYARNPLSPEALAPISRRARGNDPAEIVPVGPDALRARIEGFVGTGISKFVLRPYLAPVSWREELETLAGEVGDLQS